ncbi:beta-glucan synthesis-associated protein-domain-containing protein [Lipomyces arxii]|uniref:beta-glucan synthesis-associated protein-domain-containing protein n=1 Tax=Lipomyces arxii TaxID=56418 RepID=UPI0034CDBFEC
MTSRRSQNPFVSPSQSSYDLSDRASIRSDISAGSDIALSSMHWDSHQRLSNSATAAAFPSTHSSHTHNARQAVYSESSSRSSSYDTSSPNERYTPSDANYAQDQDSRRSSRYSRVSSSGSLAYPHAVGDPTSAGYQNGPDYSPFGGYPVSSFPLHIEDKEPDDYMHNPDPVLDAREYAKWSLTDRRGFTGAATLLTMVLGAIAVFIVLPVLTFTGHTSPRHSIIQQYEVLTQYEYPILGAIRMNLIDPDTPKSAYTRTSKDGKTMNLVFSDEFNQEGRTFYEGEDQFWQAINLQYAATTDLEWYDPDAITTVNGTMVITIDAFKNHGLNYRSGMLQSWNKMCFKGGAIQVSTSLPGPGNKSGLWPGIWTMGNLGRPGYLSTTDGLWPYAYDDCDAGITPNQSSTDGISYLPGQRLNSCTCRGEDHPNPGVGRGAPEIDAIEAANGNINASLMVGVASQSLQVAPFDPWYMPDYEFFEIYNDTTTVMNTYAGGPFQEAISGVTVLNNDWYDGNSYQSYGFEYVPGKGDGYIQWLVGDTPTWSLHGESLGPNGNVATRHISQEPMSVVINMGLSNSWAYIDWQSLLWPKYMRVDHVRIYQLEGQESVTCDPPGYPTTEYIANHPQAYRNPNATSWSMAGYDRPRNTLMDKCKA